MSLLAQRVLKRSRAVPFKLIGSCGASGKEAEGGRRARTARNTPGSVNRNRRWQAPLGMVLACVCEEHLLRGAKEVAGHVLGDFAAHLAAVPHGKAPVQSGPHA